MKNTEVKDVQATPEVKALTFKQVKKGQLVAVTYPKVEKVDGVGRCVAGTFTAVVDSKSKDSCEVTFNYPVRKARTEYVQASQSYTFKAVGATIEHHGPSVQGQAVTLVALTPAEVSAWEVLMSAREVFLAAKEKAKTVAA